MSNGNGARSTIPVAQHRAKELSVVSHYNAALNLSVDFFEPDDDTPQPIARDLATIVEDYKGHLLDVKRPEERLAPNLQPASPYGATFLSKA